MDYTKKVVFAQCAGMPEKTLKYGADSLAHASANYLESLGVSREMMILNPVGYNTVQETLAACQVISHANMSWDAEIIATTSWWHVPRVWLACRIIFGRHIRVVGSKTTLRGRALLKSFLREIPGLPKSYIEAVWWVYFRNAAPSTATSKR